MQLEPGMRVRCVDAGGNGSIATGEDYFVQQVNSDRIAVRLFGNSVWYRAYRFKPIVRVKAPTVTTLRCSSPVEQP